MYFATREKLPMLNEENWQFALKIYKQVKDQPNNIVISPFSVYIILTMTTAGVNKTTEDAVCNAVCFLDNKLIAQEYNNLLYKINKNNAITLKNANRIYASECLEISEIFKSIIENEFNAKVEPINLNDKENTIKEINNWIQTQTNNNIKKLIEVNSLHDSSNLILINAIYFKGTWESQFDKSLSYKTNFYLSNNRTMIKVKMMYQRGEFAYLHHELLQTKILMLPYKGKNTKMIIFLPNNICGLADLEKKINKYDLTVIEEKLNVKLVDVYLPKFKIESEIKMKKPLEKMGFDIIFSKNADFSEIVNKSERQISVAEIIHKAFIEVDEEGTETPITTPVKVHVASKVKLEEFRVDHPFLICVYYKNIIIFIARVLNPVEMKNDIVSDNYEGITLI